MDKEIEEIFSRYIEERGNVPEYAKILAEESPEFLVKWGEIRSIFRGRGVLPEKFKELLLMASSAMRLDGWAVETHIQAALKLGATKQEIVEAALVVWPVGGMTSLSLCLKSLVKVLNDAKRS